MILFLKYWKLGASVLILTLILGYIGVLKHDVNVAKAETVAITKDFVELQVQNNSLKYAVKKQNDGIELLNKQALEQEAKIAKAKIEYNKLQNKYNKDIKDLTDEQPDPNLNDCDNTRALIKRLQSKNS